jgi:hypothetical protein
MNLPQPSRSLIGFRTAMILFAALAGFAIATLKGTPLFFALLVIFALAAKSYIHHIRSRIE